MAKTAATLLGIVFLLVGVAGFFLPGLLGTHLSLAHNVVHLVSGAIALYLGLKGSLAATRMFCLVFGAVYALLGVAGFLLGKPDTPGLAGMADMGADPRLLKVLPGTLELGTMDHTVHILLGAVFLIAGFMTKASND